MNQVQQLFEYLFQNFKIFVIVQPWETGIRVRFGKITKKLYKGVYFKIPFFDNVYIQEARLRIVSLPVQTLTTKDGKTVTLNASIGYCIIDIEKLYNTIFHPEISIQNITMAAIATFINKNDINSINPQNIDECAFDSLKELDYGLKFTYCKITNYAVVKTFRLIQDHSWINEGLEMNKKH